MLKFLQGDIVNDITAHGQTGPLHLAGPSRFSHVQPTLTRGKEGLWLHRPLSLASHRIQVMFQGLHPCVGPGFEVRKLERGVD